MEELIIKSTINNAEVNSVNARDLHKVLEIKTKFNDWVNRKIDRFSENLDYISLTQKRVGNNANQVDYVFTIDTAKMIAMMENNLKGDEVRRYFIELEKEYIDNLENKTIPTLTPFELSQQANAMYEIEIKKKEKQLLENKKIIDSMNIIESATHNTGTTITVQEFCKIVTDVIDGTSLGRTSAYAILRSMKLVMAKSTEPTQASMTRKLLNYIKHDYGYTTVIYSNRANDLIKLMVKHLQENSQLNSALGYPLGDL